MELLKKELFKIIKVKNSLKKHIVVSGVAVIVACTGMVATAAGLKVTCGVHKESFLEKRASSYAENARVTGVIMYKKNGDSLASGESALYNENDTRFKAIYYTGLSSAYKGWAYALDMSGAADTDEAYY